MAVQDELSPAYSARHAEGAEEERTLLSEPGPKAGPEGQDAVRILPCFGRHLEAGKAGPAVEGEMLAEFGKARVHLGAHGAGHGAGGAIGGPEPRGGESLGHVLTDRERVPDQQAALLEQRYVARGRNGPHPLLRVRPVKGDLHLRKGRPGLLEGQPGPQRPGGVAFASDVEDQAIIGHAFAHGILRGKRWAGLGLIQRIRGCARGSSARSPVRGSCPSPGPPWPERAARAR